MTARKRSAASPDRPARKVAASTARAKGAWGGVRANSGGPRPGSGRPRDALPRESLQRIGPPPDESSLRGIRWVGRMMYEVQWLRAQGKIGSELAAELRGGAAVIAKLVPEDLRADVDRALKELEERSKPKDQGPQTEQHLGEQPSLRGMAR